MPNIHLWAAGSFVVAGTAFTAFLIVWLATRPSPLRDPVGRALAGVTGSMAALTDVAVIDAVADLPFLLIVILYWVVALAGVAQLIALIKLRFGARLARLFTRRD